MIGKVFTLGVLYFVQGLPYGFQDKFIPMFLRAGGLSHTRLSLMKLLLLPWLCKAGFAPLIDLFWSKWLWLMSSLAMLTVISFCGMFISTEHVLLMSIWLFLLNLCSAFQDVSVDSIAILMLKDCERGYGNTAQVVGYKLGALLGGGVLFWIHYYHGWAYLCLSLASLYIMSIVTFFPMCTQQLMARRNKEKLKKAMEIKNSEEQKRKEEDTKVEENEVLKPFSIEESHETLLRRRNLKKEFASPPEEPELLSPTSEVRKYTAYQILAQVFSTEGTFPVIVFLLVYKLGERGALSTFALFLVDQGVSTRDIGLWSGIIGQLCNLVGSIMGGWLASRKTEFSNFLFLGLLSRSAPIFVQLILVNLWDPSASGVWRSILFFFSASSLCILDFTAGLVTTFTFTLMMSCSLHAPAAFQATHYSVLASVEVAGKLLFASMAGALIDFIGISKVYFMFLVLSSLPLLIMRFIDVSINQTSPPIK